MSEAYPPLPIIDYNGVTPVILAGGLGTRLRPISADRPKVLMLILGRPFIAFLLDRLAEAGVKDVVLAVGYQADAVREAVGDRHGPIRVRYSIESEPIGTGGALRLAAEQSDGNLFLVLNGDSYCAVEVPAFLVHHRNSGAPGTLALVHREDTHEYGRVDLGAEDRIAGFLEKSDSGGPGWVNAGVYALERKLIESIPAGRAVSLEREMFPAWAKADVRGYRTTAPLYDIGTPERFAGAEAFLITQVEKPIPPGESA